MSDPLSLVQMGGRDPFGRGHEASTHSKGDPQNYYHYHFGRKQMFFNKFGNSNRKRFRKGCSGPVESFFLRC